MSQTSLPVAVIGAGPIGLPTGGELVERYLRPLAALPAIAPRLRLKTKVLAVARQGFDKMKSAGRRGMVVGSGPSVCCR